MRYGRNSFIRLFVWGLIWILWSVCRISAQTLPPEALEARHRIQVVAIVDQKSVEFAEEFARKYSKQFGMRAYVIHKETWYKVLMGDFPSPKKTNAALKTIKKHVKDAWPVAPDNDKVVAIWENGRPLDFKKNHSIPISTPTPTPELIPTPTPSSFPTPEPPSTPTPAPAPALPQSQVTTIPDITENDVVLDLVDEKASQSPRQQRSQMSSRSIIEKKRQKVAEQQLMPTKTPEIIQKEMLPHAEQSTKIPLRLSLPEAPEMLTNLSSNSSNTTPAPLPGVKEVDLLTVPENITTLAVSTPNPSSETSQEFLPKTPDEDSQAQMPLFEFSEKQETVVVPIEEAPVNTEITEIFGVNPPPPKTYEEKLTTDTEPDFKVTPIILPDSSETDPMSAKSNAEKSLAVSSAIPETPPISEEGLEPSKKPTEEQLPAIRIDDLNLDAVFESPLVESTEDLPIMVISPDDDFFLTSSHEKELHLWDKESGVKLRNFTGHKYPIVSASFSPDGEYVISASRLGQDGPLGEIRLWERDSGKEVSSFHKDIPMVDRVGFSNDGQYAYHDASGERVWWDLKTGEQVQRK